MVVSIDISGILEEKLRRLVDLGIYASVSEAVRDAVRRLLQEIDMKQIAMNLYIKKGTTIYYASSLAETPIESFIEYLLTNNIVPAIGHKPNEEIYVPPPGAQILLDPLSLYILYKSKLNDIFIKLSKIYDFYYPSPLEGYLYILVAKRHNLNNNSKIFINIKGYKIKEKSPPPTVYLTPLEYSMLNIKKDIIIMTDDINYRNILIKHGIKSISSISMILSYKNMHQVGNYEIKEIIYSLKIIPYLIPVDLEELLLGG